MAKKAGGRIIAENRRAYHEYHVLEKIEAGIALTGTEVKSLRNHHANMADAYAAIRNGEAFLQRLFINPYEQGNRFNHEPMRERKLLLHKAEINRLLGKCKEKGLTLVPLKMYWHNNWAKVEIGLVKGKQLHDKRDAIASKDAKRQIERAMKAETR